MDPGAGSGTPGQDHFDEIGGGEPATALWFTVMNVTLTDAFGQETTTSFQGTIGVDDNGDLVQEGIFEGLETPPTGDQDVALAASVNLPVDTTGAVAIYVSVDTIDMTEALMGDLNGDGQITFEDRVIVASALGTPFGQLGYDPRGDFDGNGVIDASDLAAMNALVCIADVNGDGVVDNDDLSEYLDWFSTADPRAEMDGLPGITLDDLDTFLAAFANGCN
ncbi:MAG: hypothetical protein EA378_01450 [Phycisphaerales bacterium]|nr:MAG: hypothetical protein EA378_01450 [Phycisphaerales bacterium]